MSAINAKIHPETAAGTEIPDQDASILGPSADQPDEVDQRAKNTKAR